MEAISTPESFHLLFYVGLMFIISQIAGNIANHLNLPRLIGYIVAGILFGPYALGWYSQTLMEQDLEFFRDFALAIIAFSIGGALEMPVIKRLRSSLTWITVLQTSFASIFVFLTMWWLLPFTNGEPGPHLTVIALILGAVSAATAPAAILSLVDEFKARGDFKSALLGIVALDDVIAIIFYSIAIAVAGSLLGQNNGTLVAALGQTSFILFFEIALGLLVGFIVAKSLFYFSEYRTMLGVLLGIIMMITGFCLSLGISSLLACVMLGFMVTNVAKHELANEAMDIIHTIQQPVFGVFFFMAGAHLNISLAPSAFALAMALTLSRFAGKYIGTRLGGKIAGTAPDLTKNLGIALMPAAGVMVGLTLNARDTLGEALGSYAELMVTVVIGATLINEFLTPFFVRFAITRAKQQKTQS
ncbi:MAG: cation:proton antiporter [Gammaproteobacteria bacterium]|nr:cation:proton antiporter [Gammaproteobacteria bacterium]